MNLSTCAYGSTDTKKEKEKKSFVMCYLSGFKCHMPPVIRDENIYNRANNICVIFGCSDKIFTNIYTLLKDNFLFFQFVLFLEYLCYFLNKLNFFLLLLFG